MIHIEYGVDQDRKIIFKWSCSVCNVHDQALQPSEGIDSVVWHLQQYHGRNELVRFGTILTQGMSVSAKLANPTDDNNQVDRIAEGMTEYITNDFEREPAWPVWPGSRRPSGRD